MKLGLIILDGFGERKEKKGNAIALANPQYYNYLKKNYPFTTLKAFGEFIGLPKGQIGSSEVNHLTIGAGRILAQDIVRINKAIANGSFFKNPVLVKTMKAVKKKNSALHLIGLLSDGGVHSHIEHLFALLKMAKKIGVKNVFVHAFLDGRDVKPKSAEKYVKALQKKMKQLKIGEIASMIGRFYAMDRDNKWNREHVAYDCIVNEKGLERKKAVQAIKEAYAKGQTDEFIEPIILTEKDLMKKNDAIIFFNFRSDRARQLTKAFVEGKFKGFKRKKLKKLEFVCLTEYDKKIKAMVAFKPIEIKNCLAEVLSKKGLKQLHCAESEKYPHVTYFFNGGREKPFKGEKRFTVKSPKVKTYDLKPEMSAAELTQKTIKEISSGKFDILIMNYANPDMVAHCGKLKPAIKAITATDNCLKKLIPKLLSLKADIILTADHGNAEVIEFNGEIDTAHNKSNVPFILISGKKELEKAKLKKNACIASIAPTALQLLRIKKPKEMPEKSLL